GDTARTAPVDEERRVPDHGADRAGDLRPAGLQLGGGDPLEESHDRCGYPPFVHARDLRLAEPHAPDLGPAVEGGAGETGCVVAVAYRRPAHAHVERAEAK